MFIRNQADRSNVRHEQRGIKAQKESYNTPQKRELIKHQHQIVIRIPNKIHILNIHGFIMI